MHVRGSQSTRRELMQTVKPQPALLLSKSSNYCGVQPVGNKTAPTCYRSQIGVVCRVSGGVNVSVNGYLSPSVYTLKEQSHVPRD